MSVIGRVALALAVAGLFFLTHHFGLFTLLEDPEKLRRALLGTGPIGLATYVALYTLLQPWGIPGTLFLIVAPLVWPWPLAYLVMMAGTMGASMLGFFTARFLARDWIRGRIPERFLRYEAPLARRPFWTVFWLRFVFWMPQPLHAFFGISSVSAANHFWGSLFGYALPLLSAAYFGAAFFELMTSIPLWGWVVIVIGLSVAALLFWRPGRSAKVEQGKPRTVTAPFPPG